jgi:hypothetical protein
MRDVSELWLRVGDGLFGKLPLRISATGQWGGYGSFDCAVTSLREVAAPLRTTGRAQARLVSDAMLYFLIPSSS